MESLSPSNNEAEEMKFHDASTAPTTPEGSLSFSPVLRPRNEASIDYDNSYKLPDRQASLSTGLMETIVLTPQIRNICCVGAGYVGGPTASIIAFQNPLIRVTVVDKDKSRIRRWNSRHPPIYESGLDEVLRIARDGSRECVFLNEPTEFESLDSSSNTSTCSSECGSLCGDHMGVLTTISPRVPNLFFTTEVAKSIGEADLVLIAVNTPTKSRGAGAGSATDMTAFEAVTAVVAQHARPGAIIVEKSTVPCRTAQLVEDTLSLYRPGIRFEVLSNPEFLAAGTAIDDLLTPDRILIGSQPTPSGRRAAETLASVYASWIPRWRIITTNVFSSELAKLVANSMLAQRISSINSIAAICEATGADVDEVAGAIGADPRIGSKFLKAGIGFGGSCFRKDLLSLVYLAETLHLPEVADYWRCVVRINDFSRDRFAARVVRCLNNTLRGKKITILGYAFKKDTNDTRESPAQEIIQTLLEETPGELAVYDPCCIPAVMEAEIHRLLRQGGEGQVSERDGGVVKVYADPYEACRGSDAILITTDFDEFRYSAHVEPSNGANTGLKPSRVIDPRPFERLEPTENDLLLLQKYLRMSPNPFRARPVSQVAVEENDPLGRFNHMPSCASDCPDCRTTGGLNSLGYGSVGEYRPRGRLDWARVSYHMKKPKWVFDGRGVLDITGMGKLGFRVEGTGRQMGL